MNEKTSQERTELQTISGRLIIRWLVREVLGVITLAALLFWSAGRLDWVMGWALVILTAAWVAGTGWVALTYNPALLAERLGPKVGAKKWDLTLMGIIGLLTVGRSVVAGLDLRFGWTTGMQPSLQAGMLVVAALGYGLVVWATAANAFFSQIVRIQTDRGHTVATGGPYRWVRHPGYVASILVELAVPIMLGSWWALIAGGVSAGLFIVRTRLEDRTLLAELTGYPEYARLVRYRLLPGVW